MDSEAGQALAQSTAVFYKPTEGFWSLWHHAFLLLNKKEIKLVFSWWNVNWLSLKGKLLPSQWVVQLLSKLSRGYQILRVRRIMEYSENSDLYFFPLYLHLPDILQPIYLSGRAYLYSVKEPFPCQQLGWVGCDSEPELSVCSEKPSSVWSGHSRSMEILNAEIKTYSCGLN